MSTFTKRVILCVAIVILSIVVASMFTTVEPKMVVVNTQELIGLQCQLRDGNPFNLPIKATIVDKEDNYGTAND